jgi:hypothetical protein
MDDVTFHDVNGLEYKVDNVNKLIFVKQTYMDPQGKTTVSWRVTGGDYNQFMKAHAAPQSVVAGVQPTITAADFAAAEPQSEATE